MGLRLSEGKKGPSKGLFSDDRTLPSMEFAMVAQQKEVVSLLGVVWL